MLIGSIAKRVRMMKRWFCFSIVLGLSAAGCGQALDSMAPRQSKSGAVASAAFERDFESAAAEAPSEDAVGGAAVSAKADRKIIYTTTVGLVVEDYRTFEGQLPKLVDRHGGFVASAETNRRYRNRQEGMWVVRVPVDSYGDFLGEVVELGFAESRSENAQDVTEEYVDIEARIANKKRLSLGF